MTANPFVLIGLLTLMNFLILILSLLNRRSIEINDKHIEKMHKLIDKTLEELQKQIDKAGK
ncbi:hypothetical protein ES702_02582 [subsurface metagenome]